MHHMGLLWMRLQWHIHLDVAILHVSEPLSLLLLGNPQGCANIDLGVKERIDRLWKGLLA
jgi:hypothetical protein